MYFGLYLIPAINEAQTKICIKVCCNTNETFKSSKKINPYLLIKFHNTVICLYRNVKQPSFADDVHDEEAAKTQIFQLQEKYLDVEQHHV